jgi:very-short-patch-repair endonuclease
MPHKYSNPPIPHACRNCGTQFMAHASALRLYCGRMCYWQAKKHPAKVPNAVCRQCRKPMVVSPGLRTRFCSLSCRDEAQRKREARACGHCGKSFVCRPSDAKRYCSPRCGRIAASQTTKKTYPLRTCQHCGKTFEHRRKDYAGKYCSQQCAYAVNKNPPAIRVTKCCLHCGTPFLAIPRSDGREQACCSLKCSKVHRAKTVRGQNHPLWKPKTPMPCEACGKVVMVFPCHVRRFRACSRACASFLGKLSSPRISSLERAMADAFAAIGCAPSAQHAFGQYIMDFAFVPERVAVECDGVYWHGRPEQQERDRRKDAYLTRHGWRVVRLSEAAITESPEACAERVASLLHDRPPASLESP